MRWLEPSTGGGSAEPSGTGSGGGDGGAVPSLRETSLGSSNALPAIVILSQMFESFNSLEGAVVNSLSKVEKKLVERKIMKKNSIADEVRMAFVVSFLMEHLVIDYLYYYVFEVA